MMTVIDIEGDVVDNSYGMMYDWFGLDYTSPSKVKTALANADDEDITVNIASNGGDVFAASHIYTALKSASQNVTVNILGLAASAASVIAMAGDIVKGSHGVRHGGDALPGQRATAAGGSRRGRTGPG
ncbi:ATP-dependent Clp protease proteolytic subunit, partial [Streptosporangium roseum]|uniref:ATP-dependent Clp protease proteolytic subunit n=1 Tax=Streptosporangium roseum TaxID=2001 RepID=UPI0033170D32